MTVVLAVSKRSLALLALVVVCAISFSPIPLRAGQNSIAVNFPASPARNTQIGAFVRQGTVYASLNDLAATLKLTAGENPQLKQYALRTAKYTITVSANNPFVSLTDRDTNTSIRQLPYRVLFGANSYFVPIVSFLPVLGSAISEDISIDEAGTTITVGKASIVYPFDILGVSAEQKENGIAVRLASQKPLRNFESWLKPEDDHTSLYVTIDNAKADTNALRAVKPNGIIAEVLVFPYPASVQIIVKLKVKATSVEPVPVDGSNDIIFAVRIPMPEPLSLPPTQPVSTPTQKTASNTARDTVAAIIADSDHPTVPNDSIESSNPMASEDARIDSVEESVQPVPETETHSEPALQVPEKSTEKPGEKSDSEASPRQNPRPPVQPIQTDRQGRNVSESLDRQRSRWKLDCIVLDAGHGGFDPGTIGVTRTKEKDVTLAVALKLGKMIERGLRDVRVVYTRKTDEFIELYKRGQIANAAGGKLFISIHCNAAARKPSAPNGFEIYLLRPGKTENALRIASRENEVVKLEKDYENRYQTLDENRFILLTMAQSAYVKYSERFAEIASEEMKNGTPLDPNGVKQAGFYVLVGASMPNVLVETAYLSNRSDEKFLKSGSGQEKIAAAIYAAIKVYKREYEMALGEGSDTGGK